MSEKELKNCLTELGFPQKEIESFLTGDRQTRLKILSDFRRDKVAAMHGVYKDLECVDYIISQVEKN